MSISRPTSATLDRFSGTELPVSSQNNARQWSILAVLGIAQLMVVLDSTIVTIALPSAQHALRFSNADRQWIALEGVPIVESPRPLADSTACGAAI